MLNIGSTDNTGEFFNGALDDLRIYNYAMSDTEVADVYRAIDDALGRFETVLAACA